MTIHIPTRDLIGILSDVVPFASPSKDNPWLRVVRLEWDGSTLNAQATDRHHFGVSTWDPDDVIPEDGDGTQLDAFERRGADSDEVPWVCVITLDDAKTLVKDYRLPPKQSLNPLALDGDGHEVTVTRLGDAGLPAKRTRIHAVPYDISEQFPNHAKLLAGHNPAPAGQITFNAERLAHFNKVRAIGPAEVTFAGDLHFAVVTIGKRFVGGISPLGRKPESVPAPADYDGGLLDDLDIVGNERLGDQ